MYAVEVSPDLVSTVMDAVVAEVTAWQCRRPLETAYPIVFFDASRSATKPPVSSKAVDLAPGVLPDSRRDILGGLD
jgi:putative transposase